MTLKIARTQREIEGNILESWALLDSESELPTWPEGQEFDYVGKPAPRPDGHLRASGAARYTVDIVLPGMLHGAILRSPHAHARLVKLDLEAARAVEGVRAAVGPETPIPSSRGIASFPDRPLLGHEVEWAGQPVAALAADSPDAAAAGLAALGAEWEPLPFVVDPDQALGDQRFTTEPTEKKRGDSEAALVAADVTIEVTVETSGQLQVPLEPHAAVADWRPDGLTVWASTQGMYAHRAELANMFELPLERVRVIADFVGGGFGAKNGVGAETTLAVELSRRSGRPVRIVVDRHGEKLDGGRRQATRQTYRLGASSDGTLVALEADAVVSVGAGGHFTDAMASRVVTPASILYGVENYTGQVFPLRLNLRGPNAFRAPGITEGITGLEQAIDELAIALKLDPLELRRRIHVGHDQENGQQYSHKRLLECYDRIAQISGWAERDRLREPQPDGKLRGMGCATLIWYGAGGPPAQATIRISSDGVATVVTGIQDAGNGGFATAKIVAAEELGFELDKVRVVGGDTVYGMYGPAAGGSMITASVMPAVRSAAYKARGLLLDIASSLLEISPDDLVIRGGRIRSKDNAIDQPVSEITKSLAQSVLEANGSRGLNADDVRIQTFGCQVARVAVDPAVGEVVVEHIWGVHDVGRVINPLGASGQVEGGMLQGMGYALTEDFVVDPGSGIPVSATFDNYKVPTIADVPEMTVEFIDLPDTNVPNIGAKGLAEPPMVPTAAAIANAFAHATGRRSPALPLTRAQVLEALR